MFFKGLLISSLIYKYVKSLFCSQFSKGTPHSEFILTKKIVFCIWDSNPGLQKCALFVPLLATHINFPILTFSIFHHYFCFLKGWSTSFSNLPFTWRKAIRILENFVCLLKDSLVWNTHQLIRRFCSCYSQQSTKIVVADESTGPWRPIVWL